MTDYRTYSDKIYERFKLDMDALLDFGAAIIIAGCVLAVDSAVGDIQVPFTIGSYMRIKDSALLLGAFYCFFRTLGGIKHE